jgi:glucose-6-phosphate isomerase
MSMTTSIPQLTKLAAWQALEAHYPKVRELHLRKLFADDPKRGERMTAEAVGKHDSSTNTLIRRYRRSKELLHGR